jgi:hypothetical protein
VCLGSGTPFGGAHRVLHPSGKQRARGAQGRRHEAQARVQRVDGELLSWYGPRALAGLRYVLALAAGLDDPAARARIGAWT